MIQVETLSDMFTNVSQCDLSNMLACVYAHTEYFSTHLTSFLSPLFFCSNQEIHTYFCLSQVLHYLQLYKFYIMGTISCITVLTRLHLKITFRLVLPPP